jgi:tetratricopeptide (TPR) repeat protein
MRQWGLIRVAVLGLASAVPGALAMQAPCPSGQVEGCLLQQAKGHPDDFAAQRELGEFYLRNHRLPDGIAYMEKAHRLRPEDYATDYDLSLAYLDADQLPRAGQELDGMIARHETAEAVNLLAEVDARSGNYSEAAVKYHRAAELDPSENNIFDLASFLLQHPRYEGFLTNAAAFFRYGVQKYPRSAKLMVGLGVTLYAQGQYDEAVQTLCAAVDLNPSDPKPYEFLGKVSKNSPALLPEIRTRLEGFVHLYPENGAASYYYAMILWQRTEGKESPNEHAIETLLQKAVAADPKLYEAHFQLGVLYQDEMRDADAIAQFNQTLELRPDFNRAHYHLVLLYSRTHQKALADQHLAALKQIKQEDADAEERGDTPASALSQ